MTSAGAVAKDGMARKIGDRNSDSPKRIAVVTDVSPVLPPSDTPDALSTNVVVVDVPVQTIDFGHPNFRDGNLVKYNAGKPNFWKKEHQVKIFANEFLPVGFNIKHKQDALEKYADELLEFIDPVKTHKFYWKKRVRRANKPIHPGENDPSLPEEIRGKHFDSWTDLAGFLGYGE